MSDNTYILPGMPSWNFQPPTLWNKGGAGFTITTDTTAQEVADAVKNILRNATLTPDEAAFELVAQASMNINWQVMLDPYAPLVAPLLNIAPAQKVDNSVAIKTICDHMEAAYWAVKKL